MLNVPKYTEHFYTPKRFVLLKTPTALVFRNTGEFPLCCRRIGRGSTSAALGHRLDPWPGTVGSSARCCHSCAAGHKQGLDWIPTRGLHMPWGGQKRKKKTKNKKQSVTLVSAKTGVQSLGRLSGLKDPELLQAKVVRSSRNFHRAWARPKNKTEEHCLVPAMIHPRS